MKAKMTWKIYSEIDIILNEEKRAYAANGRRGERVIIKERSEALVNGYIPLYTQAQNIQDEPKRRDSGSSKCGKVDFI